MLQKRFPKKGIDKSIDHRILLEDAHRKLSEASATAPRGYVHELSCQNLEGQALRPLAEVGDKLESLPEPAAPSKGSYDPVTSTWTIGDLAAEETAFLDLTVEIEPSVSGTEIVNAVTIAGNEPEANLNNNDDSATTLVLGAVPTLGQWGLIVFILGIMAAAIYQSRRRPRQPETESERSKQLW